MSKRTPKCSVGMGECGACMRHAEQRVVTGSMIVHRCADHAVTDDEAAANGWRLFPVTA